MGARETAADRSRGRATFWPNACAAACRQPTASTRTARSGVGRNSAPRLEACRAPAKVAA